MSDNLHGHKGNVIFGHEFALEGKRVLHQPLKNDSLQISNHRSKILSRIETFSQHNL